MTKAAFAQFNGRPSIPAHLRCECHGMLTLPTPQIPCGSPERCAYRGILRDLRTRRLSSPKQALWWSFFEVRRRRWWVALSGLKQRPQQTLLTACVGTSLSDSPQFRWCRWAARPKWANAMLVIVGRITTAGVRRGNAFPNALKLGGTAHAKVFPGTAPAGPGRCRR